MMSKIRILGRAVVVALPLAACNQTTPGTSANVTAAPSAFRVPDGAGCKGEIARYRAIMDNDLSMGHVNQSVYNKVDREIGQAEAACGAGRDAEATRMVAATKSRYGYR